ncbi:MAG: fasciclin domain-containing protein [Bacteroidales bacterium]|nr:fasciclin domain-containing protein [Bacteroidales bacterium]
MKLKNIFALIGVAAALWTSCSDEPDSEYYYSFTGEMMSEYLQNREQFSLFSTAVQRAGLDKQLSAYGHYTCFAPDNEAVTTWLQGKGLTSLDELSDAQCDTLARTHLIRVIYAISDMKDGVLATQNMNGRPVEVTHDRDEDGNSVVILNRSVQILFATQNDSVENGLVHPINGVLENSTNSLTKMMADNPTISIYNEAFAATGIGDYIASKGYLDDTYESTGEFYDYITGSNIHEAATPPDNRLYGFTTFVVTDSVLKERYNVTSLEDLYKLACKLYDPIYPEDVDKEEHDFDHLSSPENPLYRFIAYHTLDRNVQGWNFLTVRDDFGVITTMMNPNDWYETLLPHTMVKCEHLTFTDWLGEGETLGEKGARYVNRRVDNYYPGSTGVRGAKVEDTSSDPTYDHMALGGLYFYVDRVLAFDADTRDKVMNCRIRMDFSTIFPEVMTNDMRMNGDRTKDDDNSTTSYDHTFKYGRNYYFPDGYLENVTVGGNGYFIYRRPRQGYWSLHGDEFICQGNYDVTFRIPPVPYDGEWQIRLGYAAMDIRGIAQIYFGSDEDDLEPQGIPLDMTRNLSHASILGSKFTIDGKSYTSFTDDQKSEDRKTLKNLGYYRGANGGYRTGGSDQQHFSDIAQTLRIVLCTAKMKHDTDYFLRVRAVSSKQGNNNEVMLDYLELVPKSVYGVGDGDLQEDDL